MSGLTTPKGGATNTTTAVQSVPQYVQSAQQNTLNAATNTLSPWIQTPAYTTVPINADQSAAYDLSRQIAQNAFSSMGTPAKAAVAATPGVFDPTAYLAQNPDVAASDYFRSNPYLHYQQYGAAEGRAMPTTGGTPAQAAVAAQAATNPIPTITTQKLGDIAGPSLIDYRNDQSWRAPATAAQAAGQGYDAAQMAASTVNGADIQALLNPYTQSVVDTTLGTMRRQLGETQAANAARSAAAGSFGGSRQAVQDAMLQRSFGDQVASTTAQLMSAGYDKATATALANAQANQSAAGANMAATNTARQFGASAQNAASLANASAQNSRDQYNATNAANLLNQFNSNALSLYQNQLSARNIDNQTAMSVAQAQEALRSGDQARQIQAMNALLGVGDAQRSIYQNNLNMPLQYLSLLQQMTPQNYGSTTQTTSPNTAPSPLQSIISGIGQVATAPLNGGGTLFGKAVSGLGI